VEGRYRRFAWSGDDTVIADMQRQACNFPIQNMVAEAVWRALSNMWTLREHDPTLNFRFLLQIHDAIMLQVPIPLAPRVYREVFRKCMIDQVPIYPTDLDGVRISNTPHRLSIGRDIMLRWGESVGKTLKKMGKTDCPDISTMLDDPSQDSRTVELLYEAEHFCKS
jgi:hypothetical protein